MTTPAAGIQPPRVLRDTDEPWSGANGLWVDLGYTDPETTIDRAEDRYRLKFGTVTLQDGEFTAEHGPPEVRADRIGDAGSVRGSTGGHAFSGDDEFWPTTVEFPSRGCWLVTTTWRDAQVRVVLEVP